MVISPFGSIFLFKVGRRTCPCPIIFGSEKPSSNASNPISRCRMACRVLTIGALSAELTCDPQRLAMAGCSGGLWAAQDLVQQVCALVPHGCTTNATFDHKSHTWFSANTANINVCSAILKGGVACNDEAGKVASCSDLFCSDRSCIGIFFALPAFGLTQPITISGLDFADHAGVVFALFAVLGFLHAMAVCRRAVNRRWYSHWYVAIVAWPVLVLGCNVNCAGFGFQTFDIPANSMTPNLVKGDHFLVSNRHMVIAAFPFHLRS